MTHLGKEFGAREERLRKKPYYIGNIRSFADKRNWFFGHFMAQEEPMLASDTVEVAVRELPATDDSRPHYHKVVTEITYVISGCLRLIINGDEILLKSGEFMVIPPGVWLQNPSNEQGTKVVVIKSPSIPADKYYVD